MKKYSLIVATILVLASAHRVHAATYIVNKDGTGSFKTIDQCADMAKAGDTCQVMAGNYDERVRPVNSGLPGQPITFVANGIVKVRGFNLDYKNRIVVNGFEITNQGLSPDSLPGILLEGSNYISILNNKIHDTEYECISMRSQVVAGLSNYSIIRGNTLFKCGSGSNLKAWPGITIFGQSNLIENNDISHIGNDFIVVAGGYNIVIRNNTLHDNSLEDWKGNNTAQIDGISDECSSDLLVPTHNLLIENNTLSNTPSSGSHFVSFKNAGNCNSGNIIVRYNTVRNNGGDSIATDGKVKGIEVYNNTINDASIVDEHTWQLKFGSNITVLNNLINGNGAALDKGTYVGRVAMTDSGNDQIVIVDDASPFQDGWANVDADTVSLGVPGNASVIKSINYSGNTITLTEPLQRSSGDHVWLFKNSTGKQVLYGSAPDLGATETNNGQPQTVAKKAPTMTVATDDSNPPTAPTNLVGNLILADEVDLTWNASTDDVGLSGYEIYRDGDLVSSVFSAPFRDTTVQPNTIYTYTVRAIDSSGNESDQSNSIDITTPKNLSSGSGAPQRAKTATPLSPPKRSNAYVPPVISAPAPIYTAPSAPVTPTYVAPAPVYVAPVTPKIPVKVSTDIEPLPDLSGTTSDATPFEFHTTTFGGVVKTAATNYLGNFKTRLSDSVNIILH